MPQAAPVAPDGGYGWVVTAACFSLNVISGGVCGSFGILLPHLIETFQETHFVMSWIASIQYGSSMLIAPLGSMIGNKIGFRLLAMIANLMAATGMFVCAFVTHFAQLYVLMGVIVGIGVGLSFLSGMVMVNQYFNKRRSISTGISVTGSGIGIFIFGQVVPLLVGHYTWRGTCIILSGLQLQNIIFASLFRPLIDESAPALPPDEQTEHAAALVDNNEKNESAQVQRSSNSSVARASSLDLTVQPQSSNLYVASLTILANMPIDENQRKKTCSKLLQNFEIFRDPAIVIFMVTNLLAYLGFAPPFVYIFDKAMLMGFEESLIPHFFSIMGAFNCVGQFAFGLIANIPGMDKNIMFLVSIVCMGIADVLCQLCQDFWSLIIFCAVIGLSTGVFYMLQCVVLCDLVQDPLKIPSALGMFMFIVSFSSVASTPLGGAIYDWTKSYNVVFWIAGVINLASAIVCLPLPIIIRRRKPCLQNKLHDTNVVMDENKIEDIQRANSE